MKQNVITNTEGQDNNWPMTPEESDIDIHYEDLCDLPGEKPFKRRNEMVNHNHTKIGEIVKILAPGEEFKFSVEIPTYKFNSAGFMKDLELRRMDSLQAIGRAAITTMLDDSGQYIGTNTEKQAMIDNLERFCQLPVAWKKQKDVAIILEAQNTFATEGISSSEAIYAIRDGEMLAEDGHKQAYEYGIHAGAAQAYFKVDSRVTTRCLPLQQRTAYSYVDQSRDAKNIPVDGTDHLRETVVNVESDSHTRIQKSTISDPFVPYNEDDETLPDVIDGTTL